MSMHALNWVYGLKRDGQLRGPRKAVLAALAYHANKAGECWPKQATLATECGVNKDTVTKALSWLEAHDYLDRARQHRNDGSRRNDRYTLNLVRPDRTRQEADLLRSQQSPSPARPSLVSSDARTNCREEPTAEPTTASVNGSSGVGGDSISTSTTDAAGAVEVKNEHFEQPPATNSQGQNPEEGPQPLVAKLETGGSRDEAEINGSGKEGGAPATPDLPAEVQDVLAAFPGFDRNDLAAKWRRRLNEDVSDEAMSALRLYCKLCVGTASSHRLKTHEAAARALPPRQGAGGRFSRPLEAVA